jgi:hypothetical protein
MNSDDSEPYPNSVMKTFSNKPLQLSFEYHTISLKFSLGQGCIEAIPLRG